MDINFTFFSILMNFPRVSLSLFSRCKEFYVSPKLAHRTDSFECPLEILGAAISLHGRWRLSSNGHLYPGRHGGECLSL